MITFDSRPDDVSAAYLPVKYVLESDRFPNTRAGESAIIQGASRQLVAAFGAEVDDTVITLDSALSKADGSGNADTGDFVTISNSIDGVLDGIHRIRVLAPGNPAIVALETKFPAATGINTILGPADVSIFYAKLKVVIDIFVDGQLRHRSKTAADPSGKYPFDISKTLQKLVGSDLQTLAVDEFTSADASLADFYINYAEEFDVFDPLEGDVLTLQTFFSDVGNSKQVLNSTIQYVDLRNLSIVSTQYDLDDYVITPLIVGQFLTRSPKTLKIGETEDSQLQIIVQKDNVNILGNTSGSKGDFEDGVGMVAEVGITGFAASRENNPRTGQRSLVVTLNGTGDNLWSSAVGGTVWEAATKYKLSGFVSFDVAPSTNKEDFEVRLSTRNLAATSVIFTKTVNALTENKAKTYFFMETEVITNVDTIGEVVCQAVGTDRPNLNNVVMTFDDIRIEKKEFEIQRKVVEFDSSGATVATTLTDLVASNNSYLLSAGTNNLTLDPTTVKYTVVIIDKDTTLDISDVITYEIDEICHRNELRFEWLNDAGGIDKYTFVGELVEDDDIQQPTFKRRLNDVRTIGERQTTEIFTDSNTIFTIGSGMIPIEDRSWLKGLYRSVERYLIVDGQRLPIRITNSASIGNSNQALDNLLAEFFFAFDEVNQQN